MKRQNVFKVLRILHILLIVATVLFIFIQSMKSPEDSKEESDKVGDIIEEIIPPDEPAGEFIQINLRKIAHFTQFFILGVEVAAYVLIFMRRTRWGLLTYPLALFTAFFDESIQIFSGRGPAIFDVWIDFFGYCASSLLIFSGYSLVCLALRYFRNRREVRTNG